MKKVISGLLAASVVFGGAALTASAEGYTENELKTAIKESSSDTLGHWVYTDFDGDGTSEGFGAFMNETHDFTEVKFINSEGEISLLGYYGVSFLQACEDGYTTVTEGDKTFVGFDTGSGAGYRTYVFGVKDGSPYELEISGTIERFMQSSDGRFYTYEGLANYGESRTLTLEYDEENQEFIIEGSANNGQEEGLLKDYLAEYISEQYGEPYCIEKWIYEDFNNDGKKEAAAVLSDFATENKTKGCYIDSNGGIEVLIDSPNRNVMNDIKILHGFDDDEACSFICFKGYHWGHSITMVYSITKGGYAYEMKILSFENGEEKDWMINGYLEYKDGKYYWHYVESGPVETAVFEVRYDYNYGALLRADNSDDEEPTDFEYTENPDGTLTLTRYVGSDSELVIPSEVNGKTVNAIGENICDFYNGGNHTITKLTIPGSVKTIGEAAFAGCYKLEEVVIESGVETIEDAAFGSCTALKKIIIPSSVENFGRYIFCWAYASDSPGIIDVEIYCYKDSAAHNFAKGDNPDSHEYDYVLLDAETDLSSTDSSESSQAQTSEPEESSNSSRAVSSSQKNTSDGSAKTDSNPTTGIAAGAGIAVLACAALIVKRKTLK